MKQRNQALKRNLAYKDTDYLSPLILFFLSPFLAGLYSLRSYEQKWAKFIFILFCGYFGYTLILIENSDVDGLRYIEWFLQLHKNNISSKDFIGLLYQEKTGYLDIVQPIISFIISRITDNYHILFAVFGLVFGYFYAGNLWYLFSRLKKRQSIVSFLFLMVFGLLNPIWNINAFRFALAIHVFLFGVFPFLFEGKKSSIIVAAFSILVHFSFIIPVLILILYAILGNRSKAFFVLFLITSLLTEVSSQEISKLSAGLPDVFQFKVDAYATQDILEFSDSIVETNWYIRYFGAMLKWICYSFTIAFFLRGNILIEKNRLLSNLFCFSMLFYSFANVSNLFPQGARFYQVANLLNFFLIVFYINEEKKITRGTYVIKLLKNVSVPILIIIILVSIRKGFDFTGIYTIIGNPVSALFFKKDVPLISLIK